MRKIQIGVMGSCSDLNYSEIIEKAAERIGELIAERNGILLFGAEKDFNSLSTAASRGAKRKNGLVIGVTYNKGKDIFEKNVDVIIASGLERGGGRELTLVLSCDVVIALNGGSGTLTELAIAYQADIPMVVLNNTGGWSEKLANTFLDSRERRKIYAKDTPEEVVDLAFKLAEEYIVRYG